MPLTRRLSAGSLFPLAASLALSLLLGCSSGSNNSSSTNNTGNNSGTLTVSVSPTSATLTANATTTFTASVANDTTASGVTWSISPSTGALSNATTNAVTYTAPSSISATSTVTLTATSKASSTATATAAITLNPTAASPTITAVTASCSATSLTTSGTTQCSANVTGTGSFASTVTWAVNGIAGGNTTLGTISSAGLYTAPTAVPATNPVTITATSTQDTTKSGSASLTITAASPTITAVTASCSATSLTTSGTTQCSANVTGTGSFASTVTWAVNGIAGGNTTLGTISSAGLYTAPTAVPATNPVTITATSTQDTTKSGSASLTITAASPTITAVTASCSATSLTTSGTTQCSANVTGTGSFASTVTWTVNGIAGGNTTLGTISSAGLYTAPTAVPATNPVTITATSTQDTTKSGSASLTLTAASANTTVSLSASSLAFGTQATAALSQPQTLLLTNTGTAPLTVNSLAFSGTNSADFLQFNNCPLSNGVLSAGASCYINVFLTPSTAAAETATLTITTNASNGAQKVALSGTGVAQMVTVGPATATVEVNQTVPFAVSVNGLTNTAVTWTASAGTITSSGIFTAPATVPTSKTVTITATSQANSQLVGTATVTIAPVTVSVLVSPAYATLATGGSEVLTASVVDTTNAAVTWTVNGIANGNAAVGTITTIGTGAVTYTAPATLPATNPVTITATSAADTTKSSSATITIASTSAITLTSLDKTSLAPYNLLTLTGTGFNPQASPKVTFSDNTGFSVTETPVAIGANTLTVGVPAYISTATDDLAAGTVNIQVTQTLGTATQTSNTLSGLQIPNLPALVAPAGAVTLQLLNTQSTFAQYLSTYLTSTNTGSPLNTTEFTGALAGVNTTYSALIASVSDVVQNPTHSFPLATVSGNTLTVTTTELARADRMIAAIYAAQAANGYGDPSPDCEAYATSSEYQDALVHWNGNGPQPTNDNPYSYQCAPQAAETATTVVAASAGIATGGSGLLLGSEELATTSAAISSQLTYITAYLGAGMTAIGAQLGQGTVAAQQFVQGGVNTLNNYLTDAIKSTIISTTFGETKGTLYDLAANANELLHATFSAPPFSDGPATKPTSTLTVSLSGTGSGTLVSYPGGIVCTNTLPTVCTGNFPTGTAVYLEFQPDPGSTFNGFSGACSGTTCSVNMTANQSVGVSFAPSSTLSYPSGLASGTCTTTGTPITCCTGNSCVTTAAPPPITSNSVIDLSSATSLTQFSTQACAALSSYSSATCSTANPCSVTSANSTTATFTASCTIAGVSGCSSTTTTATCTYTLP